MHIQCMGIRLLKWEVSLPSVPSLMALLMHFLGLNEFCLIQNEAKLLSFYFFEALNFFSCVIKNLQNINSHEIKLSMTISGPVGLPQVYSCYT